MNRPWIDVGRASAGFALATSGGLLAALIPLAFSNGADASDLQWVGLAAVACGGVAGLSAVPAWLVVAYNRPSFWTGAAAGILAVLIAHGVAVATLTGWAVWYKQRHPSADLGYMGGILWLYFGIVLAGVVTVPGGAVIGGGIGVLQRRRHRRQERR
jgi:hypothetical protein